MSDSQSGETLLVEPRKAPFRVGDWLAEPAWNRIRRESDAVKLEPRVMRLLATLAAAPACPMTRRQLLEIVWPDVLVNEEALSRAVSQLRRALGDDPRAPRFVETVHKGGYCLIAPVMDGAAEEPQPPKAPANGRHWLWPLVAIVAAAVLASILYWGLSRSPSQDSARQLVPLTSEPGREIDPAVSSDGTRVVYLASSGSGYDLFVRRIGDGVSIRLTSDVLAKGHPTWSPNADRVAFVAAKGDAAGIYTVSSSGGAAVKLVDLPSWSFGLDWSPDGRTLAYSDAEPGQAPRIVLLDLKSKEARPIGISESSASDTKPVFSPDGKQLAFIRTDALDRQQIAVVDLERDRDVILLGATPQQLRGIDWAPDGKSLIFSARSGRRFGLWQLHADGSGALEPTAVQGGDVFNPTVSSNGRIVVEDVEQDRDIWRVNLAGTGTRPLIQSTFDDYEPAFAPVGKLLAFVSERSGTSEIWLRFADAPERRLTNLAGPEISRIFWSHDGQRLAFLAEERGNAAIYVTRRGGKTDRLLRPSRGRIPIGWAAAQDRLFMLAPEGREWRLEVLDLVTRKSRRISAVPIETAAVTNDGRSIYAIASREKKLLRITPYQGAVRQFRLPPSLGSISTVLPARDAVFLVAEENGVAVVHRLDLKTERVEESVRLDFSGGGRLTLAPDAQSIAYTHARETANDLAWTRL